MIHQDIRGLIEECDEVIAKSMSLNVPITDTENEHSLMVFILHRNGRRLCARSATRAIRCCAVELDAAFHMDELLQDLHTDCEQAINNSKRYEVYYE